MSIISQRHRCLLLDKIEVIAGRRIDMGREHTITAKEAAEILGLKSPATVLRWARDGIIPSIRVGTGKGCYVRFLASALADWMQQKLSSSTLPLASSQENVK